MRFLVTATPKFDVPPELLPSLLDAEPEWRERYRDRLDAYAWFPGGGGFGIVDVDSEETLTPWSASTRSAGAPTLDSARSSTPTSRSARPARHSSG